MLGTIVNTAAVVVGGLLGLLFKNKINPRYANIVMRAVGLCVLVIGIKSVIGTEHLLVMVLSLVIGALIGEFLRIETGITRLGELLGRAMKSDSGGGGRFAEGFAGASVLFCVGAMAIMGCLEAGVNHNYSILFSKSLLDLVSAITLAAAMGVGVVFSGASVLVYQGILTILAGLLQGVLDAVVVAEMSAAGGVLLIALGINLTELSSKKLPVANLLPAIFMPIWLIPLSNLLSGMI